jgi:uncharacterized membrane protein YvlD (DUF360 family)
VGTLVTVGVNSLAFFIISKLLPGFRIKDEKTAVLIALAFSFLMFIGGMLALPLMAVFGVVFGLISIVPFVGPLIASSGMLITVFIISFTLAAIMLIVIDKMMEDFEMASVNVALIASFLLAVLNVVIRSLLGV